MVGLGEFGVGDAITPTALITLEGSKYLYVSDFG